MYQFKVNKLTEHVTQILDPTEVSSFLITGEREALLVDTGVGIYGLKAQVDALTQLPVTVVLTHGHGDHTGGAGEFESVYLHPADTRLLIEHGIDMRRDYAKAMLKADAGLTEADFVPDRKNPMLELKDGQVFDLGGIHVEFISVSGHTKGSCTVLIQEERSMIYGDALNCNTLVMDANSAGISTYLESLKRLQTREGEYDVVYYSHGSVEGPKSCLEDNIELCEKILAGTDEKIPCEFMGQKAMRAAAMGEDFARLDGKFGNIMYTELTRV